MVPFSRSSGIIILLRYSKQFSLLPVVASYNYGEIVLDNLQKKKIIIAIPTENPLSMLENAEMQTFVTM